MSRRNSAWCIAILVAALFADHVPATAEGRIALVIGNSAYSGLARLKNPMSDAKLMTRTLRNLGFDVAELLDADAEGMKKAIQQFGRRIEQAGGDTVSLFYYAGHGLQVNGLNYLVPVNARIQRESDVEIEAVDAGLVLRQMEDAGSRVNLMILDACRNNPLPRGWRSLSRGLAVVNAPRGSLIAYSTAPGSVSMDGEGENSPYTQALAKAMQEPGLAAEEAFRHVRVRVLEATYGNQVPWESSSLTGAFYFSAPPAVGSVKTSEPQTGGSAIVEARLSEQAPRTPPPPPAGIPTTPPAVARGDIAGRWEGQYQCQDQDVGFSLNITNDGDNRIAAIFEFFPLPGTLSFPRGSFRMAGNYDRTDGSIHLQSAGWLKRPLGFQSHDIEGQLEANGAAINGRILTTGCAHFVLTRR
jgi:Caspase domain